MKPGRGSQTAVVVCMGRAVAHGVTPVAKFSDPTALALLSESARARVERIRENVPPKGLRESVQQGYLRRQSKVMVARTITIDDAVREAATPQVVILGAGLDGRAWRMTELRDATVFEVDHPDTQKEKRSRTSALPQAARDVRFVPVDFARDDLDTALKAAGHDALRPTTWIWEGVVMYLAKRDIEATLAVVERRSAPQSRLVVLYHSPAFILHVVGLVVRWLGEPLRSVFSPDEMRALLARYRFDIVRDEDVGTIGERVSRDFAEEVKFAKHLRIVTAQR